MLRRMKKAVNPARTAVSKAIYRNPLPLSIMLLMIVIKYFGGIM
jgi:hypothetical protein